MPELCGDGWMVVGDAGQFVNAVHREGSNLAMTTGRMAGETVVDSSGGESRARRPSWRNTGSGSRQLSS